MFKLNYKQLLSLPVALVKYGNRSWLYEKILVWTFPSVTRDYAVGIFVLSFCFLRHRSSHFLLLYVIISFSIYYYWVRFLQLKYTEPLYGQLQASLDLAYDIRHLYRLVTLSPYILGLFSHICTIGLYLFYAGKSVLLTSEMQSQDIIEVGEDPLVEDPLVESAAKFLGLELGGLKALIALKGFAPWFASVKNSSAGFFPISMTSLLHLQCIKDPEVLKPLREAAFIVPKLMEPELGWDPYPVPSASGYWVSPRVQSWSVLYRGFLAKLFYGTPGKYISFAYMFDNMGTAPFFGRFTNDLELIKLLGNFSFEKFSLLEFFSFSFRTAFRLWIPIFSVGYKDALAWWIHPYSEMSLINVFGYSRYIFEPFMIAISLVLENSIQQIYASFYMDQYFFPIYHFLNQWNKLRPATLDGTRQAFLHSLAHGMAGMDGTPPGFCPGPKVPANLLGSENVSGEEPMKWALTEILDATSVPFKPSKISKFILTLGGYTVKYAPIYIPCEEARIRTQLLILEILFLRPFIIVFKIFTFGLKVFAWLVYDSFIHFIPEVIFNPF
jgi:hypothetical protein